MLSRRQIREAVVQFLYCADLEGGADPASLREPFWQFVTESDRRALMLATWKTIHHLSVSREQRHNEFAERLPAASAILRADPNTEKVSILLDRIASLESEWSSQLATLSRIPRNDDDDSVSTRFEEAIGKLFRIDRDLSSSIKRFFEMLLDHPRKGKQLEAITGSLRRLDRISDRMRMIESPEDFPERTELAKIRDTRVSIQALRDEANRMTDSVLGEKESIDERLHTVIENFSPERIDPIDRAILRLATWEILHDPEVPAPVAINEAIELAKRFGTSDSGRFVNGVLDKVAKS
ncbi:transcription antitermination factor NusB [Haloferula chungangensis]|uniref:Transcription antitermination factor NusB n=1 Tax=Haloferula chungangensis TaxID=1048331 RepID=A0ABW2LB08_9BACT